jgi:hypothetical protein
LRLREKRKEKRRKGQKNQRLKHNFNEITVGAVGESFPV